MTEAEHAEKLNLCGKRVKLARVDKDMAQIDLSAALGVDFSIEINQNGISDLERFERHVKDVELVALANILDVHPMWLLFGEDIPSQFDK